MLQSVVLAAKAHFTNAIALMQPGQKPQMRLFESFRWVSAQKKQSGFNLGGWQSICVVGSCDQASGVVIPSYQELN